MWVATAKRRLIPSAWRLDRTVLWVAGRILGMTDEATQRNQAMRAIQSTYRKAIADGLDHPTAREQALRVPEAQSLSIAHLLQEINGWDGTVYAPGTPVQVFGDPGVVTAVTDLGYNVRFDDPQLNIGVLWYESSNVEIREQMTKREAQTLADAKAAHPDCLGAVVFGDSKGPAFVISGWRK